MDSNDAVVFEGYLFKKSPAGLRGLHPWQKRFFEATGLFLTYYSSDSKDHPINCIRWDEIDDVVWLPQKKNGTRFDVRVVWSQNADAPENESGPSTRVYALRAPDRNKAIEWVTVLQGLVATLRDGNDPDAEMEPSVADPGTIGPLRARKLKQQLKQTTTPITVIRPLSGGAGPGGRKGHMRTISVSPRLLPRRTHFKPLTPPARKHGGRKSMDFQISPSLVRASTSRKFGHNRSITTGDPTMAAFQYSLVSDFQESFFHWKRQSGSSSVPALGMPEVLEEFPSDLSILRFIMLYIHDIDRLDELYPESDAGRRGLPAAEPDTASPSPSPSPGASPSHSPTPNQVNSDVSFIVNPTFDESKGINPLLEKRKAPSKAGRIILETVKQFTAIEECFSKVFPAVKKRRKRAKRSSQPSATSPPPSPRQLLVSPTHGSPSPSSPTSDQSSESHSDGSGSPSDVGRRLRVPGMDSGSGTDSQDDVSSRKLLEKHTAEAHALAIRCVFVLYHRKHNKLRTHLMLKSHADARAAAEFTQFCKRYVGGRRLHMSVLNCLVDLMVTPLAQLGVTLAKREVGHLSTPVLDPLLWDTFFAVLPKCKLPVRFHALRTAMSLLYNNDRNVDGLMSINRAPAGDVTGSLSISRSAETWQQRLYPLLADLEGQRQRRSGQSHRPLHDKIQRSVMSVFLDCHMRRFWSSALFENDFRTSIDLLSTDPSLRKWGDYSDYTQSLARQMIRHLLIKLASRVSKNRFPMYDHNDIAWKHLRSLLNMTRRFVLQTPWWRTFRKQRQHDVTQKHSRIAVKGNRFEQRSPLSPRSIPSRSHSRSPSPSPQASPLSPGSPRSPRMSPPGTSPPPTAGHKDVLKHPREVKDNEQDIALRMLRSRPGVQAQDRTLNLTLYKNAFRGSDAVQWMYEEDIADTRKEAVVWGNKLMMCNFIYHVQHSQPFRDTSTLYQFMPGLEQYLTALQDSPMPKPRMIRPLTANPLPKTPPPATSSSSSQAKPSTSFLSLDIARDEFIDQLEESKAAKLGTGLHLPHRAATKSPPSAVAHPSVPPPRSHSPLRSPTFKFKELTKPSGAVVANRRLPALSTDSDQPTKSTNSSAVVVSAPQSTDSAPPVSGGAAGATGRHQPVSAPEATGSLRARTKQRFGTLTVNARLQQLHLPQNTGNTPVPATPLTPASVASAGATPRNSLEPITPSTPMTPNSPGSPISMSSGSDEEEIQAELAKFIRSKGGRPSRRFSVHGQAQVIGGAGQVQVGTRADVPAVVGGPSTPHSSVGVVQPKSAGLVLDKRKLPGRRLSREIIESGDPATQASVAYALSVMGGPQMRVSRSPSPTSASSQGNSPRRRRSAAAHSTRGRRHTARRQSFSRNQRRRGSFATTAAIMKRSEDYGLHWRTRKKSEEWLRKTELRREKTLRHMLEYELPVNFKPISSKGMECADKDVVEAVMMLLHNLHLDVYDESALFNESEEKKHFVRTFVEEYEFWRDFSSLLHLVESFDFKKNRIKVVLMKFCVSTPSERREVFEFVLREQASSKSMTHSDLPGAAQEQKMQSPQDS